jgi:hypothetical protein
MVLGRVDALQVRGCVVRRRRWKLAAALALVLAAVVAAGVFVCWPRPELPSPVTPEKLARIQRGMSRADVEAILGPPGNYSTGPRRSAGFAMSLDDLHPWHVLRNVSSIEVPPGPPVSYPGTDWTDDEGSLTVFFGPEGVHDVMFFPSRRVEQGRWENFLWRAARWSRGEALK